MNSAKKWFAVLLWMVFVSGGFASVAWAVVWENVLIRNHKDYQTTALSGETWISGYTGGFPLRLQGIVVNANEDWLDPTATYDSGYHAYSTGGQAEIIVQASAMGDSGGTFSWMGQNYGNMPWIHDFRNNYTDADWYSELNRLQLWHPSVEGLPEALPKEQLVRPGDYVEIRAQAGLWYGGKMNVNEQHSKAIGKDFEIVVLERGRGWSEPENLTIADLKNADNSFIFNSDAPQASGGEKYQGSQVTLQNVHLVTPGDWQKNKDVLVADGTGRTFTVHLSLGSGFLQYSAPQGTFSVTGILDQSSATGNDGYRLLVMNSGDLFQSWTNASAAGFWNSAMNWGGDVPVEGEAIHFAGMLGGTATNDFEDGRVLGGIVFESNAGPFTLDGSAITLSGDLVSFSSATQTVAMPVTLTAEDHTIYAAAGVIVLENSLTNGGYLRKIGPGTLTLAGGIQGDGMLDVANGVLNAPSIVQGALVIGGNDSGNAASATVPEPAAWLVLMAAALVFSIGKLWFQRNRLL